MKGNQVRFWMRRVNMIQSTIDEKFFLSLAVAKRLAVTPSSRP